MRVSLILFLTALCSGASAQDMQLPYQKLNSSFDELNPVLSPDGNTLYLTIANHPQNIGGKSDPGDIWISTFDGVAWTSPTHGGSTINDRSYNAVAGISADGSRVYFFNHFSKGTTAKSQGISRSVITSSGFSVPENIYIPYFHSKSNIITGRLSADEKVLLYSAESYGSFGVEDIYVSINNQGKWTDPRNLGATINSAFQELTPWLSDDGKRIYFSTNGRSGSGSFDVYSASRLDDSWTSWSEPVNLGEEINTPGRELFYQVVGFGNMSVLTSTTNSDGYGDVRMIKQSQAVPVAQVFVADADTTQIAAPVLVSEEIKATRLFGKVFNSKTGEVINAKIEVSLTSAKEVSLSGSSGYELTLTDTGTFAVMVVAPGFVSVREKVTIGFNESREFDFSLQPAEEGTTVNLKNVLFLQGKPELLTDSYDELDLVVSFLKENPGVRIELSGHTDNRGVHEDNVRLSQQRVNAVKAYLVSKGIEGKRISGKGYGGTKPIASNENEETRKMNRRVEFTIKKS